MECDSMHSYSIVGPMYCPRDYVVVMQSARQNPEPYQVIQLTNTDFKSGFNNLYLTSIRPGKKAGDPVVTDLKEIRYRKGILEFKIDVEDDWMPMPQRIKPVPKANLKPMFKKKLLIKKRKFDDLQALKHVIPDFLYGYYDSLPHM